MQKNLVIVESPAKAKTIEKFLGKDYKVLSSFGHIRDLKKKELTRFIGAYPQKTNVRFVFMIKTDFKYQMVSSVCIGFRNVETNSNLWR